MLPGGFSPQIVPEEAGNGTWTKLIQKTENRFGSATAQLSYSPVLGHSTVTKGIRRST